MQRLSCRTVRIREVPSYDILTGFSWLSSVSPGKFWDSISIMSRPLPHNPFQFATHRSICLYNWNPRNFTLQIDHGKSAFRSVSAWFIVNAGPITTVSLYYYCVLSCSSDILMHFIIPLTFIFCCAILLIQISNVLLRTLICVGFGVPVAYR